MANVSDLPDIAEILNLEPADIKIQDNVIPEITDIISFILKKDRKIYLDEDVSESTISIQQMIMYWNKEDAGKPVEERKPIMLYVMSYGGDLDYMWMIVDAIETSITPVYTINLGVAHSAASIIFMSGKKRFMAKRAKIVVHEGSASFSGDAVKVLDASDDYKKALKTMKDYILERSQIPKTILYKKRANDWTLDSNYCLENKVCDKIIESVNEIM